MSRRDNPGRQHPLYRAIKLTWWVVAIWLAGAVLFGVIRGTFVTGPVIDVPAEKTPPK